MMYKTRTFLGNLYYFWNVYNILALDVLVGLLHISLQLDMVIDILSDELSSIYIISILKIQFSFDFY